MAERPSPEEMKKRREAAAQYALMRDRPMSVADFAPEEEPPAAFASGSPSSPEGQRVYRAMEQGSLTPQGAPSATALMAEEALGGPVVQAAGKALKAAPLVGAATEGFSSMAGRAKEMVKRLLKGKAGKADEVVEEVATAGAKKADEEADAAKQWQEKGVESPYFKRWFEGSKVTDEGGKPLVVYHGTPPGASIEAFDSSKAGSYGMLGKGTYFSPDLDYVGDFTVEGPRGVLRGQASEAGMYTPEQRRVLSAKMRKAAEATPPDESWESSFDAEDKARLLESIDAFEQGKTSDLYIQEEVARRIPEIPETETEHGLSPMQLALAMGIKGEGSIYPVYLSLKNPVVVKQGDVPASVTRVLEEKVLPFARKELGTDDFDTRDLFPLNTLIEIVGHRASPASYRKVQDRIQDVLRAEGYDGVAYLPGPSDWESPEYLAFSPEQIKSATGNVGTFDLKDPRIAYGVGAGAVAEQTSRDDE